MSAAQLTTKCKIVASRFPQTLDRFPNPRPTDTLDQPPAEDLYHDVQHRNVNDAVLALERKLGIDQSTDTNSLTYQAAHGRASASVVSASLATNATDATLTFPLGRACTLLRINTNRAAWVRIYSSAAARSADASRVITVDPSGEHGILLEALTTSENLSLVLAPAAFCWNAEDPITPNVYLAITNKGTEGTITVTVDYLPIEMEG